MNLVFRITTIIAVVGIATFYGCTADNGNDVNEEDETIGEMMSEGNYVEGSEKVSFTTDDGWEIVGDYYTSGAEGAPCVLLLHMMPADRHSFDIIVPRLVEAGYDVLNIDLRGHGESLLENGEENRFIEFDDATHASSNNDIIAARMFLKGKGADIGRMAIIGASIGANLAISYAATDEDIKNVVLLSPGIDYRSVTTDDAIEKYGARPSLIITSEGDEYSVESCRELKKIAGDNAELIIYEGETHGTDILVKYTELEMEIVSWISASL